MAETRDLIVRSSNTAHTKSFIRIGDESPLSVSETGSSLQFLQNLSSSLCTFDTAGTTSAFRIRHDTVNGYLIFEGRSGSNGPYQLMRLNDDTNTVTFGGTVAFEDISFDQITGSHLYVATSSRLLGTTSISFLSMTSSLGTASIWYDDTMHIDGFSAKGTSWKSVYKLTSTLNAFFSYPIYTTSAAQVVQNSDYLSVFLNGDLLLSRNADPVKGDYYLDGLTQINFQYDIPVVSGDDFYLTYVYSGGDF